MIGLKIIASISSSPLWLIDSISRIFSRILFYVLNCYHCWKGKFHVIIFICGVLPCIAFIADFVGKPQDIENVSNNQIHLILTLKKKNPTLTLSKVRMSIRIRCRCVLYHSFISSVMNICARPVSWIAERFYFVYRIPLYSLDLFFVRCWG